MEADRKCQSCGIVEGTWRCLDCAGRQRHCTGCFRNLHLRNPFHRVENWTGDFFQPAWLFQAGVDVFLGHGGNKCPSLEVNDEGESDLEEDDEGHFEDVQDGDADNLEVPDDGDPAWQDDIGHQSRQHNTIPRGFARAKGRHAKIIVDSSGVHSIQVYCCRCPNAQADDTQYMKMGLFPASFGDVKTAFSFKLLDDFRVDNLECKTSALGFWRRVVRTTCSAFPKSVPVSC